ncbi:hypothetical protein PsorP6_008341 [Peronosclerospora sorghi]|uniref:Uncharacterized protein n=1 Tax=Peronosclerospora sorghi TaxID=230839 RepID=A0ACC0W979_9STRA|nr:hypothetical protein PsorP6_008341 [Peronosclerospora sorghi]
MNATNFSRVDAHAMSGQNDVPKQQLPLRRGYFGRVRLTRDEMLHYLTTAKSILEDALNENRQVDTFINYRSWKQLGSSAGFKRFTRIGDNNRDLHYRVQGTVHASVNDLMGLIYADSTAQLLKRRAMLYNDSLDAQTLCVLKERSAENMDEHVSIRWAAINLSNNSPLYQRDMCFLEFTGLKTEEDGSQVAFMIKHAVDLKECVSLKESHGLSRLDFTEIMLLRPTKNDGHTEITLSGVIRHPENLPGWLFSSFLGNIATSLSKLAIIVQERLLARLPKVNEWQFVPHSARKCCHVCSSKFNLLSKKSNCRSCGEVACKSCIVTRTVGETTKFCTKCILMVSSQTESIACQSELSSLISPVSTRCRSREDSDASVSMTSSMLGKSGAKIRSDTRSLEDAKTSQNNCSTSSTASEASYDSPDSYCVEQSTMDTPCYSPLDEEVIETLDTTEMNRCGLQFPSIVTSQNTRPMPSVETAKPKKATIAEEEEEKSASEQEVRPEGDLQCELQENQRALAEETRRRSIAIEKIAYSQNTAHMDTNMLQDPSRMKGARRRSNGAVTLNKFFEGTGSIGGSVDGGCRRGKGKRKSAVAVYFTRSRGRVLIQLSYCAKLRMRT